MEKRKVLLIHIILIIVLSIALGYVVGAHNTRIIVDSRSQVKAKDISKGLLRLANYVSNKQVTDKDQIAERIEELSSLVQKEFETGALCGTDSECAALEK